MVDSKKSIGNIFRLLYSYKYFFLVTLLFFLWKSYMVVKMYPTPLIFLLQNFFSIGSLTFNKALLIYIIYIFFSTIGFILIITWYKVFIENTSYFKSIVSEIRINFLRVLIVNLFGLTILTFLSDIPILNPTNNLIFVMPILKYSLVYFFNLIYFIFIFSTIMKKNKRCINIIKKIKDVIFTKELIWLLIFFTMISTILYSIINILLMGTIANNFFGIIDSIYNDIIIRKVSVSIEAFVNSFLFLYLANKLYGGDNHGRKDKK